MENQQNNDIWGIPQQPPKEDIVVEPLDEWETDPQTMAEIQSHVAAELPLVPQEPAPEDGTIRVPFTMPRFTINTEPAAGDTVRVPIPEAYAPVEGTQQFPVVPPVAEEAPMLEPLYVPEPAPQQEFYPPQQEFYAPQPEQPVMQETQQFTAVEPVPEPVPIEAAIVQDTPKQEAVKEKKEDPSKTRPAWKKGYGLFGIPHIVSTVIWLMLIVVIGVSLGRLLWVCCADVMAFGKPDYEVTVTLDENDVYYDAEGNKVVNMESVSQKLAEAGLIDYPELFTFFAELTDKDEGLITGEFTLNAYYDYNAMINIMSYHEQSREIVTVLIPEGYNCAQIFALLEENGVCTAAELEECAKKGNTELEEYWFLTNEIPWGEKYCLEGYLFPDTYDFYTNDEPAHVLNKMLQNFDARFTDKMKSDLEVIKARYGLTLHEVLTIASMVEEEAVGATKNSSEQFEGYNIASVYYNRLANWSVPILGCDATVYYAMEDYFGEAGELTAEHLQTDSPYNTRKYAGLPPGPITNPGSYSMYAALSPNDTEYYYYVYDPEQKCHILSKTEEEHNKLVAELGY